MLAANEDSQNARYFDRSKTTVTDTGLWIGARYFPIQEVLGGQVFDVTEGNRLIEDSRKMWFQIIGRRVFFFGILPIALYILASLLVPSLDALARFMLFYLAMRAYLSILDKKLPVVGTLYPVHEYRLKLHTRYGSEEVITAADYLYLSKIADDINMRVHMLGLPNMGAYTA